jgi:hypothetical protein
MNERYISEIDIVEVAKTISCIRYQGARKTYLLSGLSTWEEKLIVSAALCEEVIIVTVFFKD